MRLQNFINEKVTKKELDDTLKNKNLWIGAEFEFKIDGLGTDDENLKQVQRDYRDAYNDWRQIENDREDYEEELRALELRIEDLKDEIDDAYNTYEQELELNRDKNRIQFWKEKHEKLEDEKEEAEKEYEKIQDNPYWAVNDYSDYFSYHRDYFDIEDVYLMDDGFPEPLDPDEVNILGAGDLDDFRNWEEMVSDIAEDMYKDADFIDRYEIGDYSTVSQTKGSNLWAFEYDQTISPDGGIEVKSPPMKLPDFIKILPKILKWIKKWGYTDSQCGLHFHMSLETGVLDYFKVIVFTEEDLIFKYFPERVNSDYAFEVKQKLVKSNPEDTKNVIQRAVKRKLKKDDINVALLGSDKYDAINKIDQNTNRVEFRYMGGTNYENKHKQIEELIKRYAFALSVACDPEWRWKEYVLRLHRILNKIEKYMLEEQLENIKTDIRGIDLNRFPHIMNFVKTNRKWEDITENEKKILIQILENKYKETEIRHKNLKVKDLPYITIHTRIPYEEFHKDTIKKIERFLKK
jgi:hypothetical protein